jgi:hypothetical protein
MRNFSRKDRVRWALLTAVLVVSAVLIGCSVPKEMRRAHLAREDLTGMSRAELVSCAGQPLDVQHAGSWEYWIYVSPEQTLKPENTRCVATFMARNGYVESLDYANPSGGLIKDSITECLSIVDKCLPEREE